jgi:hypothetical protein
VNQEPDARPAALLAVEPGRVEAQHERPHHPIVRPAHLPATSHARRTESPVRIVARRLPSSGPAAIDHAAVEHPLQRPLKVVMRRGCRPIARDVEAQRHAIRPGTRAVRHGDRDERRVRGPKQPDRGLALRRGDAQLRRTQPALSVRPSAAGDRAMARSRSVSDGGVAEGMPWSRGSSEAMEASSG